MFIIKIYQIFLFYKYLKYFIGILLFQIQKKISGPAYTLTHHFAHQNYISVAPLGTECLTAMYSNGSHLPSDTNHRHPRKQFLNHGREDQSRGSIGVQRRRWNFNLGKKCKDIVMEL